MSDEDTVLLKGDRTKDVDEQYNDTVTSTKKRTCKETIMHIIKRTKEEEEEGKFFYKNTNVKIVVKNKIRGTGGN